MPGMKQPPRFLDSTKRYVIAIGLFVLVVGTIAAWSIHRSNLRSAAISAIEEAGGEVYTEPAFNVPAWVNPAIEQWIPERVYSIEL